jgi:cytosine/adenosine deaminase-related metal-dependent hydrolase
MVAIPWLPKLLGWVPGQAIARYESAKNMAVLFGEAGTDKNHISLNPHAPYSVSDELWKLMSEGFPQHTITMHNQESAAENEFFRSGTGDLSRMYSGMKIENPHFTVPGINSLGYVLPRLKDAARILLVHNTFSEEKDLLAARDLSDNIFYCFCPGANEYIENRLPDIPVFLKLKSRIVLGTDSLASNHQLSILEEMKTIKKTFPSIPTAELLIWATSNGAQALAFEEKLGDFSKGKKPGVVLIENLVSGEITDKSKSRRIV